MLNQKCIVTNVEHLIAYAADLTIIAKTKGKLIKAVERLDNDARQFRQGINDFWSIRSRQKIMYLFRSFS